jgi:hypothetical protein
MGLFSGMLGIDIDDLSNKVVVVPRTLDPVENAILRSIKRKLTTFSQQLYLK